MAYPTISITPELTPELAKAAEVSLRGRAETGDSRRTWVWPWRCALWARLRQTDCARMLDSLVSYNLLPNAITTHPPLQLDGNLGLPGAFAEVLVQSHAGVLELLPAVDFERWPKGSLAGARARTGLDVAVTWEAGGISEAQVFTRLTQAIRVRAPKPVTSVTDPDGNSVAVIAQQDGTAEFEVQSGKVYHLTFD